MLNKVIIMGRITHDVALEKTSSDKEYVMFSVAVDQPPRNCEKKTDFFRCSAWGDTAGFISRYFKKGSMILLEGSMHNDDYTDTNGMKHYGMRMTVSSASFTGERRENDETDTVGLDGVYSNPEEQEG